jgi:ankyrin repeat protein
VRFLAERGADLAAKTKRGLSALHIACALGHLDAARELVSLGADASAASELARIAHHPAGARW